MTQTLPEVNELIARVSADLRSHLADFEPERPPVVIGIRTGGVWVARELARELGLEQAVGEIDIGFHRDDFAERGLRNPIGPTRIQSPIEGDTVILADDVVLSGRTIRAALNAIFEYGRPRRVLFATLIDLEGRELPIQPDASGASMKLQPGQRLKLHGPDPLRLVLHQSNQEHAGG